MFCFLKKNVLKDKSLQNFLGQTIFTQISSDKFRSLWPYSSFLDQVAGIAYILSDASFRVNTLRNKGGRGFDAACRMSAGY